VLGVCSTRPVRVTHFVHRLPPEYSGAALQALALIDELEKHNEIRCSLMCLTELPNPVHRKLIVGDQLVVRLGRGLVGKFRQVIGLYKALKATNADVLHVHGFYLTIVLLGILMSKKIVLKTSLLGVDDVHSLVKRYPILFRSLILPRLDAVISLNKALSSANATARNREQLVPNGVRWADFAEARSGRDRAGVVKVQHLPELAPDTLLFLYVGGDSARKGFGDIPAFWRLLTSNFTHRRLHLLVVGRFASPASRKVLDPFCREGSVTVVPEVVALKEFFRRCDVFVSLSFAEGLPNAVLEAVAANILVVARELPGVFDGLLDQNNSIVFDELDVSLVDRLRSWISSERHRRINNAGRSRQFGLDVIGRAYADLYERLV
jgi:glycosyltransferase involved in cell wall biosynthesis